MAPIKNLSFCFRGVTLKRSLKAAVSNAVTPPCHRAVVCDYFPVLSLRTIAEEYCTGQYYMGILCATIIQDD